jgi:hypothetical protein
MLLPEFRLGSPENCPLSAKEDENQREAGQVRASLSAARFFSVHLSIFVIHCASERGMESLGTREFRWEESEKKRRKR